MGLDAAALRAALRRARGASATSATCASSSSWTGREHGADGGAAQPAARDHARCRRCSRRPTRRRAGGSRRRWRCASPTSTPTAPPTTPPAPRWTRCAPTPSATGSSTTGCGRPSARPASCCGTRRGGPSPSAHRTTCGSSRSSARSPSATGASGAGGPRGCGTPRRRTSTARACELAPRVAFHAWLQDQVQRQLSDVRGVAQEVGVRVVHDLAVGCDPEGADGWALQDVLAMGVHVGAPPDAFSQQGQDWGLPPWRPDRLDATGYAAYRDLLRATAAAGGRAADRPRRRAVAAVVGAAGRVAGPGHLRALRLRRHARRAHAGGVAGRARW